MKWLYVCELDVWIKSEARIEEYGGNEDVGRIMMKRIASDSE